MPSTPTCGCRWARRPSGQRGCASSSRYQVTPGLMALRQPRRGVHALPSRPPRPGGRGRGDRRAASRGLAAGRQPAADRAGAAALADHGKLGRAMTARDRPLVVLALGGNALLRRGEPMDAEHQRRNVAVAAAAIAALDRGLPDRASPTATARRSVCWRCRPRPRPTRPYPLDVLGAESEGMIGYLIEQALGNHLGDRADRNAADPGRGRRRRPGASTHPTKPIGPIYDEVTAHRLAAERGWTVAADGPNFRRVVASPEPLRGGRDRDHPDPAGRGRASSSAPAAAASRWSPTRPAATASRR